MSWKLRLKIFMPYFNYPLLSECREQRWVQGSRRRPPDHRAHPGWLGLTLLTWSPNFPFPGEPRRQDEEEDLQGPRKDQPLHVLPLPHRGKNMHCSWHWTSIRAFPLHWAFPLQHTWDCDIIRSPWWRRSKRLHALMSPRGRRSPRRSSRSKR